MASEAEAAIKKVNRAGDDYYSILGISRGASEDEIKKVYRKLALRLHPDKCQEEGTEEAFKRVGEAFGVLSDPKKKEVYDQYGVDGLRDRGGGGGGGGGHPSPEDIFEAFFGGQGFPGGTTFVRGGSGGGFQTFRVNSGGGGNVFHFSSSGFPGGMHRGVHQRRGGDQDARERREEEEAGLPEWVTKLQSTLGPMGSMLGPLLPIVVLALLFLGMVMVGTIMQILLSRAMIILPVCYVTQGRTKVYLLMGIIVLALFGIL